MGLLSSGLFGIAGKLLGKKKKKKKEAEPTAAVEQQQGPTGSAAIAANTQRADMDMSASGRPLVGEGSAVRSFRESFRERADDIERRNRREQRAASRRAQGGSSGAVGRFR